MMHDLGETPFGNTPDGLWWHVWRTLGRLEEGQKLNRQTADERTAELKKDLTDRIEELKDSLGSRIDRLERTNFWRKAVICILRELPWRHMGILAGLTWLAVHGHLTAPDIKAFLFRVLGLGLP